MIGVLYFDMDEVCDYCHKIIVNDQSNPYYKICLTYVNKPLDVIKTFCSIDCLQGSLLIGALLTHKKPML